MIDDDVVMIDDDDDVMILHLHVMLVLVLLLALLSSLAVSLIEYCPHGKERSEVE